MSPWADLLRRSVHRKRVRVFTMSASQSTIIILKLICNLYKLNTTTYLNGFWLCKFLSLSTNLSQSTSTTSNMHVCGLGTFPRAIPKLWRNNNAARCCWCCCCIIMFPGIKLIYTIINRELYATLLGLWCAWWKTQQAGRSEESGESGCGLFIIVQCSTWKSHSHNIVDTIRGFASASM